MEISTAIKSIIEDLPYNPYDSQVIEKVMNEWILNGETLKESYNELCETIPDSPNEIIQAQIEALKYLMSCFKERSNTKDCQKEVDFIQPKIDELQKNLAQLENVCPVASFRR